MDAGKAADWLYIQRQQADTTDVPTPRGTAKSYFAIAKAFDVDVRKVGYWRRQGAPIIPRGINDLAEIGRWRTAYEAQKSTMGSGTSNHYVTALRGFGKWLAKNAKRADSNPFENLDKIDARADVRKDRRVLPSVQFNQLIIATSRSAACFKGLNGNDRAMIYTLAAYTGLRASEIGSLTKDSFDFEESTVTARPAYTKNNELAVIPLRSDLAQRIQEYLRNRPLQTLSINERNKRVWPGTWTKTGAEMIRRDLKIIDIPYTDEDGKTTIFTH